jgi:hypothetical protein
LSNVQIQQILPKLSFYFTDFDNLRNGWGDCWHIAAVTARFAKGFFPICHSRQILTDLTRLSQRDMPTVAQTLRELATLANGLEAES